MIERVSRRFWDGSWYLVGTALLALGAVSMSACGSPERAAIPDTPDTPFKLATVDAGGRLRLAMVLGTRVVDIAEANARLTADHGLPTVAMPADMRTLIEQYETLKPRLYQLANHHAAEAASPLPFVFAADQVSFKAPIKYPWNVLAAAANYRAHAEGMGAVPGAGGPGAPGPPPSQAPSAGTAGRPGSAAPGFNAAAAALVDPDRDAPVFFAKSPRSCIIDPGEPYYIPVGRERIDWEGELAIVMGRPSYMVTREQAHDHVFGYSIMYDVSDRGGRRRDVSMFPGPNWFEGKSTDRGAPFGPVIVPKEFLPNPYNLSLVTRINGVAKQEGNTRDLIWQERHLISYLTSILTLYPGDVVATGTPAGTGAERQEFLKAGDVVTIEIEGIGTLTTPIKSAAERPAAAATE